jgi:hypothetical protein
MADDPFPANGPSQRPTDARTREWADLTEQLITELGMSPAAARLAAAQELGLAG